MHGIIFAGLKKYVVANFGNDAWNGLLKDTGIGSKIYLPTQTYPDQEIVALVTAASQKTGKPAQTLLEGFGEFIVADLATIYRSMIKPEWRTLDLIENTEGTMHKAVRLRDRGATPPTLVVTRTSPDEVVIVYSSARKMCGVAKGIVKGIARHYNEQVTITESSCMLKGNPSCTLSVKLAA
jgi:hypothetical protein